MASIAEVYGPGGFVDAPAQRATFAGALAEALAEGYSGIRVAADNTPLVADPERLASWVQWEIVADRFMSDNPVTGLCAFDRERIEISQLRHLATLHPLWPVENAVPQFQLFADGGALCIEGEVDSFAMEHVWKALESLPPKTDVVVDVTKTTLVGRSVMAKIRQLCDTGVEVTVRALGETLRQLRELAEEPTPGLSLVEA